SMSGLPKSGPQRLITACRMSANCCHAESIRYRQSVLYTTGYTRNAIVHNGMLDQGTNSSHPTLEHRGTGAENHPRRPPLSAATSIFSMPLIASNARFAPSPPAASASVSPRGVICQETPHLSLHQPHSLSCPPLPRMAFQ